MPDLVDCVMLGGVILFAAGLLLFIRDFRRSK